MPVAAPLTYSSAANNSSTTLSLLSVLALFLLLLLSKLAYCKYRRLHSIHVVPASASAASDLHTLINESDNGNGNRGRKTLGEKVEKTLARNAYLVGFFGSPEWEANMRKIMDAAKRDAPTPSSAFSPRTSVYSSTARTRTDSSFMQSPSFTELCGSFPLAAPEAAHVKGKEKQLVVQPSMSTLGSGSMHSSPTLYYTASGSSPSLRHQASALALAPCELGNTLPGMPSLGSGHTISRMASLPSISNASSNTVRLAHSISMYLDVPTIRTVPPTPCNRASVVGEGKRTSYHKPTLKAGVKFHRSSPSLRSAISAVSAASGASVDKNVSAGTGLVSNEKAMVQVGSLSRRDSVTTTSAADLTVEAASISTASQPPDEDKENQAPGTAGNQEEFGRANTQGSVSKSAVRKRGPQKSWTRTRSGADNSPSVAASRTLISKAQPYSSMPSRTPRRPFASITQTLNSVDPPNLDRYASLPDLRDSSVGSCYSVSSGCASSISSDGRVSRSASSAGHLSPASTTGCGSSSVSSPAGETVSSCYSRSSSIGSGPNLAGIGAGFGLNASMPMQPSPLRNSALGNAGTARGKSGNTGNRLGNVEIDGHGASAGDALRNSAGTANVSAHGGMRSGELAGLGFEDLRLRCEDGCIRMR